MKTKLDCIFIFSFVICMFMNLNLTGQDQPKESNIEMNTFLSNSIKPFWSSEEVIDDSLFFVAENNDSLAQSRLLAKPIGKMKITSNDKKQIFEEGKDFIVDQNNCVVTLTKNSRIPFKKLSDLYIAKDSPTPNKYSHKRGDPNIFLLFGEGHFFHDMQLSATYKCDLSTIKDMAPNKSEGSLNQTENKLKNKLPIKICVSGDSISRGGNASGFTGVEPNLPAYPDLVKFGLESKWGTKVELKNFAVGGWTTIQGVNLAPQLAIEKPDLVIIAYGMNDSGSRDADEYQKNVQKIITEVLTQNANAEFILVTSMLPNSEWSYPNLERFKQYREKLLQLKSKSIAIADMTSTWVELLKRKKYLEVTGNGLNHPNDLGHRLYAQVILNFF